MEKVFYIDINNTLYTFSKRALKKFQDGDHTALVKHARKTTDYLPPTAILLSVYTYEDEKEAWEKKLSRDFPDVGHIFIQGNKEHFARKELILIDDYNNNGDAWSKAGGIYWKFINKYNSISKKYRNVTFRNTKKFFDIIDVLTGEALVHIRKEVSR
jgi:hypothetical protein